MGALTAFLFLFWKSLERYLASPVIVAMDKRQRAVWEIPFPAVTVCPETKMNAKLFNYTDVVLRGWSGNITDEEMFRVRGQRPVQRSVANALMAKEGQWKHSNPGLLEVSPPPQYFFQNESCMCTPYCTVPGVPVLDYKKDILTDLSLQCDIKLHFDDTDFRNSSTIDRLEKVQLHGVADFPRPDQDSFLVPLDSVMRITVTPSEILADASMRERYSVEQRQCYFPGERPLRFFLQYTQSNCRLECLANFTLSQCGCVPFYMPRDQNTPICSGDKIMCSEDAAWTLQQLQTGLLNSSKLTCSCLQSCVYIHYSSQRSRTPMDLAKMLKILGVHQLWWTAGALPSDVIH
ncbi:Sodium channel protein Nach [Gryllus bimaculatus]|nr:Sodium channel protein Nach [Gryllus bimaculatus]